MKNSSFSWHFAGYRVSITHYQVKVLYFLLTSLFVRITTTCSASVCKKLLHIQTAHSAHAVNSILLCIPIKREREHGMNKRHCINMHGCWPFHSQSYKILWPKNYNCQWTPIARYTRPMRSIYLGLNATLVISSDCLINRQSICSPFMNVWMCGCACACAYGL